MLTDSSPLATAFAVETVDPLGDSGWDRSLLHCPHASFYHSSAWARVLCDTYGFKAHYLTIGPAGTPLAVLPLMEIRSVLTGRRGVSLPFTDDCEPAGSEGGAFERLYRHAQALGQENGWKHLEVRGGVNHVTGAQTSLAYFGHRVPLSPEETVTFGRFHSSVRRAVRKAERSTLKVEFSSTLQGARDFYTLFCKTRKRHGLPPQPFRFYESIQRHVLGPGLRPGGLARLEGEPVAGAMFFHGGGTALMKFAASDLRFQHLRINNLVLWEAMKHYGVRGFHTLDFGRTSLWNEGLLGSSAGGGPSNGRIEYMRYDYRRQGFACSQDGTGGWQTRVFPAYADPVVTTRGRLTLSPHGLVIAVDLFILTTYWTADAVSASFQVENEPLQLI